MRYKVLPARLASAVGVKKFSLQARNGLVSPFCGVLGEFCPGWPIGAACWESFIPVRPAGFRAGRVSSRRWSCVRYKVLPARLVGGLSGTKFSLQARNGLVSPFCGVLGEFCPAHRVRLPDRRGCEACGGCICGAEGRRPDWRVARGLQGLAGLRGDAPSEARGAVGERAGRPRAAREVWRGAPHGGLATGCLADGERAGRPRAARRSGRVRDRAPVTGYCAGS